MGRTNVKRLGILGGTFDPPHLGHLWLAEAAQDQLKLDCVVFLPVGQPVHKERRQITAVSHRLTMVETAIADNDNFLLDDLDANRPPPHTTISVLPLIQAKYQPENAWLIAGSDSLQQLPTWEQPQKLIELCQLAVLPRRGIVFDWSQLEQHIPGIRRSVDLLIGPTMDISATSIREWARNGRSLRYLVPQAVYNYIQRHNLYQTKTKAPPAMQRGR